MGSFTAYQSEKVDRLTAENEALRSRLAFAERVLRAIANADWRGNKPGEVAVAQNYFREVESSRGGS